MEDIKELAAKEVSTTNNADRMTTITDLIDKTRALLEGLDKSITEHADRLKTILRQIPEEPKVIEPKNPVNSILGKELSSLNRKIEESIHRINLLTINIEL